MSEEDELVFGKRAIPVKLLAQFPDKARYAVMAEMAKKSWRVHIATDMWLCPSEYKHLRALLG